MTCRREGHEPAVKLTITSQNGVEIAEYLTKCLRCDRMITVAVEPLEKKA